MFWEGKILSFILEAVAKLRMSLLSNNESPDILGVWKPFVAINLLLSTSDLPFLPSNHLLRKEWLLYFSSFWSIR